MCVLYKYHVCGYVHICISVYVLSVYVYAYIGWVYLYFDTDRKIKVEEGLEEKIAGKGWKVGKVSAYGENIRYIRKT